MIALRVTEKSGVHRTLSRNRVDIVGVSFSFLKELHRKEVIQPHVPVRLPCYDLAPVTRFTLGSSFHAEAWLGH